MKKVRLLIFVTLCVLSALCLTLTACNNNSPVVVDCEHSEWFWDYNDSEHWKHCDECGKDFEKGPHELKDVYNDGTVLECVCGYRMISGGGGGGETHDADPFEYRNVYDPDTGRNYIEVVLNLSVAQNKELVIPSVLPESVNPYVEERTITDLSIEYNTSLGDSTEMYSSIVLPDTIENITVNLTDVNGEENPLIARLKTACKHQDNGYYLGTASNPYYALLFVDEATEITLHPDTKIFNMYAFSYGNSFIENNHLRNLTSVTLPNGLTRLPKAAFRGRQSLRNVNIPESIKVIPQYAFADTYLTHLTLPEGLETIEGGSLPNSLSELVIPDSVKSIGYMILGGRAMLSYLQLGSGLTDVNPGAFDYSVVLEFCNKSEVAFTRDENGDGIYLKCFDYITDPAQSKIRVDNDFKFFEGDITVCFDYVGDDTSVSLPEQHNGDNYYATPKFGGFANCEEIYIPVSVLDWWDVDLGESFGVVCAPSKVTGTWNLACEFANFGNPIVGYDKSVEAVVLGDVIPLSHGGNFTKITITSSVKNTLYRLMVDELVIEDGALSEASSVTLSDINVTKSLTGSYYMVWSILNNNYHVQSLEKVVISSYKDGDWLQVYFSGTIDEIEVAEGVTEMPSYAFAGMNNVGIFVLPESLREIPDNMFAGTNISELDLPDVTSIGERAFYDCKNLTSLVLPDTLRTIGSEAFYGCDQLQLTDLPDSVTQLGLYAFNGNMGERADGVIYMGNIAIGFDGSVTNVELRSGTVGLFDYAYGYEENNIFPRTIVTLLLPASLTYWQSMDVLPQRRPDNFESELYFNLSEISVNGDNGVYSATSGLLYNKEKTQLLYVPFKFDPNATDLPDTLTAVDASLFEVTDACLDAKEIVVVDGWVVNIPYSEDEYQLNDETKYADGVLKDVKYSYQGVSYWGTSLVSADVNARFVVVYPYAVDITSNAFEGCVRLYGVYFHAGVNYIGSNAFWGCTQGVNRYFEGKLPNNHLGYDKVDNQNHLQEEMVYENVMWDEQTNNLYISDGNGGLLLCGNADTSSNGVMNVTMPDEYNSQTVSGIADYAFNHSQIRKIEILSTPEHVKTIGAQAFKDARNLSALEAINVVEIGAYAFSNTSLSSRDYATSTVEFTVTATAGYFLQIENNAFEFNSDLFYIDFGTENIIFSTLVFNGCTSLGRVIAGERTEWWTVSLSMSNPGATTQVTLNSEQLAAALKTNETVMYSFMDTSSVQK